MNKIALYICLVLIFILSACGSAPTAVTQATSGDETSTASLNTDYANAVSIEEQLMLGLFGLEGTGLAVTTTQAAVLEPLWQQIQELSLGIAQPANTTTQSSSTDTQAQVDALVQQVQAAMSSEQIQAIADMELTQDSLTSIMEAQGITMGGPSGQAGAGGQQPPQGNPPTDSAQMPQGTPPADNGQSQPAMPSSGQSQPALPSGQLSDMPPEMVQALVQLLQNRIAGTTAQGNTYAAPNTNSAGSVPGSSGSTTSTATTSVYTLDGQDASLSGQAFNATDQDESAIYVTNGGSLILTDSIVTSTGNTSSTDNSSFYGLNAAVLAANGGSIELSSSQVKTSGTGANGAFSTGSGSTVTISDSKIIATGDGGHAVMATQGGVMVITNVDMSTSGGSSSAVATDRGGGTITVTGGTVQTAGMNSAGIYSTGSINATGTSFASSGAEVAVIEGANSITLVDSDLTSTYAGKWGVMIYQSMSGDAEGTQGTFNMTGGSLSYTASDGPLFYVNNSTAIINLKDVDLTAASGILVKAASGNWGSSGSNGGTVILGADAQLLTGSLVADNISSISLSLKNGSVLEGAINTEKTAKAANLTLDASSTWNVTDNSTLASLSDAAGINGASITNIIGNGHTVYYDSSLAANSYLGGKTYSLSGGGTLQPLN
jgi:hypothetical protein